ncbi:MAG TPA: dynamin family protein [Acidimicrobiales bacterium]|nr:dynamin family protein [Acidimicrobiales bacterium]
MTSSHPTPISTDAGAIEALHELIDLARSLEGVSGATDVAGRVVRLIERFGAARYHIAVLGDFKRGKSTLVNALIGRAVLPSGVVPLTTVATEVHIGSTTSLLLFGDGTRLEIDPDEIADYVTEKANPSNAKGVVRAEVGVAAGFGAPGLVLVDTPGFSSVNESNTEEARRALLDADGAIVVLAADNPLSKSEREVLEILAQRQAGVFVVVNRADTLTPDELAEVRSFVSAHVEAVLGTSNPVFCVSARRALEGIRADTPGSIDFDQFRAALDDFIEHDLTAARRSAALAELGRLGSDLERRLDLEEAADALDAGTLDDQIAQLTRAVEEGRGLLVEDEVVLGHDVEASLNTIGVELSVRAATSALDCRPELSAKMADLPRAHLEHGALDVVESLVRGHFEPIRLQGSEQVESQWLALVTRFTRRMQGHLDSVVAAAKDLFDVHLPRASVPTLGSQGDHFSYHFLYLETQNAVIGHAASRLVPSSIARRRAYRRAAQRLAQEFDKHAGRARYDFAERLRSAKEELTRLMEAEFEQTQASLLAACVEARALRQLGDAVRTERATFRAQLRALLSRIAAAIGDGTS